jgi:hypothetical protein
VFMFYECIFVLSTSSCYVDRTLVSEDGKVPIVYIIVLYM